MLTPLQNCRQDAALRCSNRHQPMFNSAIKSNDSSSVMTPLQKHYMQHTLSFQSPEHHEPRGQSSNPKAKMNQTDIPEDSTEEHLDAHHFENISNLLTPIKPLKRSRANQMHGELAPRKDSHDSYQSSRMHPQ